MRVNQSHSGGKTLSSCSMSFTKNVVGAETSYQMLEVLSLIMTARGLNLHLVKITVLTFLVNQKYEEASWGIYFFRINKDFHSNLVLVVVFILESNNPLSPSIHIQILQTDLYTFP